MEAKDLKFGLSLQDIIVLENDKHAPDNHSAVILLPYQVAPSIILKHCLSSCELRLRQQAAGWYTNRVSDS